MDLALANSWPVEIDFRGLPSRIILMKNELDNFVYQDNAAHDTIVYKRLVERLTKHGSTIKKFANAPTLSSDMQQIIQPG
jgi:hypothetical protein